MPTERKPDFIVLYVGTSKPGSGHLDWFVIEMKTSTSEVGRIVEQLQSGANAIQYEPKFAVKPSSAAVFPLVLRARDGRTRANDYLALQSRRVTFRGQIRGIFPKACGIDLGALM